MKHILWCCAAIMSFSASAQTCYSLSVTTPTERFTIHEDGTVTDTHTGLMWQRCSYGQTFDAQLQSCTGDAQQLTWQQALQNAHANEFAGFDDWQVPNAKELASIVERTCVEPSINLSVFLSADNDNYWSNTSAITPADHAWVYEFYSGKNSLHDKTADVYLRLVRYQQ
ncbi:DUF1566 domain-containing protein [Pseudoalteromonas sp. SSDWG2]|uniref:Lcl C-terminal domain-containing protein n=1 Tax=Pseudoalteromonas sp. SSDWG2 TaxID=3139391 RepID=UPI003BABC942